MRSRPTISPELRAFYDYHSNQMEPWDGPAALIFTDGIHVGATLDRNGLRPGRWTETTDGLVVIGSETGVLEFEPERIKRRGRAAAGQDVSRRHRGAPDRRGRRDQARARRRCTRGSSGSTRALCVWQTSPSASTSCIRRHPSPAVSALSGTPKKSAGAADPDGADGRRTARRHGVGHADRGSQRAAEAAVRLLHPAVRAGHQPAAGFDPRRGRHEPALLARSRTQPARLGAGPHPERRPWTSP